MVVTATLFSFSNEVQNVDNWLNRRKGLYKEIY